MKDELFIKTCKESSSMNEAALKLKMPFSSFKRKAIKLGCYETNQCWNKDKTLFDDDRLSSNKIEDIFNENSVIKRPLRYKEQLKKVLNGDICSKCGRPPEWEGEPLSFHLDHVNGDDTDNRLENLRFLCPNCHSQTLTYCGKNIKKKLNTDGFYKYSLEDFLDSVSKSKNYSEVCENLNIRPAGGNIETIKKKMIEYELDFGVKKEKNELNLIEKNLNKCSCGEIISKDSVNCRSCAYDRQRKVTRPDLKTLLKEINTLGGYSQVGRKYGVTGNAIKRWIKTYENKAGN